MRDTDRKTGPWPDSSRRGRMHVALSDEPKRDRSTADRMAKPSGQPPGRDPGRHRWPRALLRTRLIEAGGLFKRPLCRLKPMRPWG